jgi:hypothetical protein
MDLMDGANVALGPLVWPKYMAHGPAAALSTAAATNGASLHRATRGVAGSIVSSDSNVRARIERARCKASSSLRKA